MLPLCDSADMHTPQAGCETESHDYYDDVEHGARFRLYGGFTPYPVPLDLYWIALFYGAYRLLETPMVVGLDCLFDGIESDNRRLYARLTASTPVGAKGVFGGFGGGSSKRKYRQRAPNQFQGVDPSENKSITSTSHNDGYERRRRQCCSTLRER